MQSMVAPRKYERGIGARGQNLRIRRLCRRGRVKNDKVILLCARCEHYFENRAAQQFLWIGWTQPGGQHEQTKLRVYARHNFTPCAARQQRRKADGIVQIEEVMLARMPHVRVDQQDTFAHLCKYRRQIGCEPAAALAACRTGNSQYSTTHPVDPAKRQCAPQRAQRLNQFALRQIRRNHVVGHAILPAARENGIVELLRQRDVDVILRQQIQLQGSVAEANVALSRKPLNFLDVLLTDSALLHQYRPNCSTLVARLRLGSCRLARYFLHCHSVLLASLIGHTVGNAIAAAGARAPACIARGDTYPILPRSGTPSRFSRSSSRRTRGWSSSMNSAAPIPNTPPKKNASKILSNNLGLDGFIGGIAVVNCTTLV